MLPVDLSLSCMNALQNNTRCYETCKYTHRRQSWRLVHTNLVRLVILFYLEYSVVLFGSPGISDCNSCGTRCMIIQIILFIDKKEIGNLYFRIEKKLSVRIVF